MTETHQPTHSREITNPEKIAESALFISENIAPMPTTCCVGLLERDNTKAIAALFAVVDEAYGSTVTQRAILECLDSPAMLHAGQA